MSRADMNSPVGRRLLAAFACGVAAVQTLASFRRWPAADRRRRGGCRFVALLRRSSRPRLVCAMLRRRACRRAALVLGFGYAAWRAEARLADALPRRPKAPRSTLVGVVDDLPQRSAAGARFAFAVERDADAAARSFPRACRSPGTRSAQQAAPRSRRIPAGERWRLRVRLKRPHGTVNPARLRPRGVAARERIRATGYVRDDGATGGCDAFAGRPTDYVLRAREAIRDAHLAALPGAPYAGVIVALTIGDQRAIPKRNGTSSTAPGIAHLISISGLHVTVFATLAGGLAFALARRSVALAYDAHPGAQDRRDRRRRLRDGYVLLAGAEVPALRTLLMFGVAALGLWLGAPGTAALVWLWALAPCCVWDPWAGLTPGFWLSFGAVGVLLYAGAGRPVVATASPTGTARVAHRCARRRARNAVGDVGARAGTLALFQQVSLVSPIANAIAIPVGHVRRRAACACAIVVPFDALWQAAHAMFAR